MARPGTGLDDLLVRLTLDREVTQPLAGPGTRRTRVVDEHDRRGHEDVDVRKLVEDARRAAGCGCRTRCRALCRRAIRPPPASPPRVALEGAATMKSATIGAVALAAIRPDRSCSRKMAQVLDVYRTASTLLRPQLLGERELGARLEPVREVVALGVVGRGSRPERSRSFFKISESQIVSARRPRCRSGLPEDEIAEAEPLAQQLAAARSAAPATPSARRTRPITVRQLAVPRQAGLQNDAGRRGARSGERASTARGPRA